jgi:hypothetical protein
MMQLRLLDLRLDEPFFLYGCAGLPSRKSVVVVVYSAVAFASCVVQAFCIQEFDSPAPIFDESCSLKTLCDEGHAGPVHAEHLSQKLLRQIEFAALNQVANLK